MVWSGLSFKGPEDACHQPITHMTDQLEIHHRNSFSWFLNLSYPDESLLIFSDITSSKKLPQDVENILRGLRIHELIDGVLIVQHRGDFLVHLMVHAVVVGRRGHQEE